MNITALYNSSSIFLFSSPPFLFSNISPSCSSSSCSYYYPYPTTSSSLRLRNPNISTTTTTTTTTTPRSLVIDSSSTEGGEIAESSATRRLVLLRHARSSWEDRSLRDHDRPLSKAGRADAISVSKKFQQLGWVPQLILSSDAARTRETLKIMQENVRGFLEADVHFISSFYSIAAMDGQTAEHLQQVICQYSRDEILTVMCMGHNRGWEEAASMFSGASIELKTCNAALLEASGESWDEAFNLAGLGGWKLHGIVKPDSNI